MSAGDESTEKGMPSDRYVLTSPTDRHRAIEEAELRTTVLIEEVKDIQTHLSRSEITRSVGVALIHLETAALWIARAAHEAKEEIPNDEAQ